MYPTDDRVKHHHALRGPHNTDTPRHGPRLPQGWQRLLSPSEFCFVQSVLTRSPETRAMLAVALFHDLPPEALRRIAEKLHPHHVAIRQEEVARG